MVVQGMTSYSYNPIENRSGIPTGIPPGPSGKKFRDFLNSSGIPAESRWDPTGIPLGSHWEKAGSRWDPSGKKFRDFLKSRWDPGGEKNQKLQESMSNMF